METSYSYSTTSGGEMDGAFLAFMGVYWVVMLIVGAVLLVAMWKLFTKAGKPGWASIVPIYNTIVLLEICGRPIWWIALFFIPVVNSVVGIILYFDLAKAFGKGVGFGLGILFLPIIFLPLLAFGDARYVGAGGAAAAYGYPPVQTGYPPVQTGYPPAQGGYPPPAPGAYPPPAPGAYPPPAAPQPPAPPAPPQQ